MRSFGSIILALVVTTSLLASSALAAIDIIYPADKTIVQRSDFLIIKGSTPVLEELIIDVNGVVSDPLDISSEEYKAAFADFLILEPTWSPGKNAVAIQGLSGGKVVATATAEIFFSDLSEAIVLAPAGFNPFVMHTPEKETLCAPCHNMRQSVAELKNASGDDSACASCHTRMFDRKYVHGPEGVFQCIDCHDSKSQPQRWQVVKDELTLCGECHVDKIDEFKENAFVHGPVATGSCVICHNPHASDQPAQLNAAANLLCSGCHSAIKRASMLCAALPARAPLSKGRNPLDTDKTMSCSSCHNPHGGAGSALFIKGITNRFVLCQECHKK